MLCALGGSPRNTFRGKELAWQELVGLREQVGATHQEDLSHKNSVPYDCKAWERLGYIWVSLVSHHPRLRPLLALLDLRGIPK